MSKKAKLDVRQLRALGHKLKPVVTVAGNGLSDGVLAEVERALEQHELIKIKLAVGDRDAKAAVTDAIAERCGAEVIQRIGNVILVLRRTAEPDPRLSNLLRPL